jgi:hypothetical protein
MLALVLKASLPVGYMVRTGAAQPYVVLCTSSAAAPTLDTSSLENLLQGSAREHRDQTKPDGVCGFGALTSAALLQPSTAMLHAPLAFDQAPALSPQRARPATSHTGPPLPARGPPVFV